MTPLLSTHLLTDKKWLILLIQTFFVWEQRQRSGSRFWRWRMTKAAEERESQTLKDTMKLSAPSKNYFRGSGWNKYRHRATQSNECSKNFEKDDTFLSFTERTTAQKATYNAVLKHESFSFVLPAIVLKIIWHINHVDISLFPPRLHRCHMLSRGRPFVFQGALGKALMPSKRKTKKKRTGTFHWSCPPSEDKANVY